MGNNVEPTVSMVLVFWVAGKDDELEGIVSKLGRAKGAYGRWACIGAELLFLRISS